MLSIFEISKSVLLSFCCRRILCEYRDWFNQTKKKKSFRSIILFLVFNNQNECEDGLHRKDEGFCAVDISNAFNAKNHHLARQIKQPSRFDIKFFDFLAVSNTKISIIFWCLCTDFFGSEKKSFFWNICFLSRCNAKKEKKTPFFIQRNFFLKRE